MDYFFKNIKKSMTIIKRNFRQSTKSGCYKKLKQNSNYKSPHLLLNLRLEIKNWEKKANYIQLFQMKCIKNSIICLFLINLRNFNLMQEGPIKNLKELSQMLEDILTDLDITKAIITIYKNILKLVFWIIKMIVSQI
jgi:hypothetical protein